MQAQENRAVQRKQSLDVISVKRNPYLVDYEEQRRLRKAVNESSRGSREAVRGRSRRPAEAMNVRGRRSPEVRNAGNRGPAGVKNERSNRSLDIIDIRSRRPVTGAETHRRPRSVQADRQRNLAAAKKRRRKQVFRRKMTVAAWMLCIFMVSWLVLLKKGNASELKQNDSSQEMQTVEEESPDDSSVIIQGLSAKKFKEHPAWTEDFLPVNEYSRPGETLPEVRDIFVHYTANPGTSAAQNRSYFEQQKDMHEASVSAHFIIGYEGEIIQCVPLNEIAYAVQTRNYDSISIECCYKAEDGSFTQETYDSLISLLAWLTDAYNLDINHILRHYDCGGKKCPIYYTEHEDAWENLKQDVAAGKKE